MQEQLDKKRHDSCFRFLRSSRQTDCYISTDNRQYINLSSNDYLGIGHDKALVRDFIDSSRSESDFYFSSSSSRLLTGSYMCFEEFEQYIGSLYNKKALYFNSGFDANSGVLQALGSADTLILADKKSHASIIDGMALSSGKTLRFKHNDVEHLKALIERYKDEYESIIIVTEALFSMDGDIAPLEKIAALKDVYDNIYIYVDEAHSFFVYGQGLGLCYEKKVLSKIDFVLVTLGKGFGSAGAVLMCSDVCKDYLINTMRPFIFTTALPPVNILYSLFILKKSDIFAKRRDRLAQISTYIRSVIHSKGLNCPSNSHIIPIILGSNDNAIKAASLFEEHGFLAMPVRHPTVPVGQARLRLSLCSFLSDDDIEKLSTLILRL